MTDSVGGQGLFNMTPVFFGVASGNFRLEQCIHYNVKCIFCKSCLFEGRGLRGPAPKKRPMISGSKIESADFYLPSKGYRILFKN